MHSPDAPLLVSSFFLNRALPLFIANNGNTTSSEYRVRGRERGKASSSITRKPTAIRSPSTRTLWGENLVTHTVQEQQTPVHPKETIMPTRQKITKRKLKSHYEGRRPSQQHARFCSLQKQQESTTYFQAPPIGWAATPQSFISCIVPALIISAPDRSLSASSPFCSHVQYKRKEHMENTISKGDLICFFSKVALLRASQIAQQAAASPTV